MRALSAVLALTGLLAGCTFVVPETDAEPRPRRGGGLARGTAADAQAANDAVRRSLADVERFWQDAYPDIAGGDRFTKVRGGFHPYTRTDPPPPCGGQTAEYAPNAFYCPDGDFIAWDAQELIPRLAASYGTLLAGVIAAHEYGHAVQVRLGRTEDATVVLEQQADCFAGAWVADVQAGNSGVFRDITPQQLDSTVAGLLELRDQPGTPAEAPQAHGNAFDRIRAFQEGVEDGAGECAGYRADNLPVTEVPFQTREEQASGGDLAYDEAVSSLAGDAQQYWQRTYPRLAGQQWPELRVVAYPLGDPPACAGQDPPAEDDPAANAFYCRRDDFAAFDTAELGPALHEQLGDNAVGMLLGDLFARAAQERRGQPVTGKVGQLTVDCLAGTWTNDLLTNEQQGRIRLSPGDLDEAVGALLVLGRASENAQASAFDRIAAYRDGVLEGLSACG